MGRQWTMAATSECPVLTATHVWITATVSDMTETRNHHTTRCIKRMSLLLLLDTLLMKNICMVNSITPLQSVNLHVESMEHYGQDHQIKLNSPSKQFHLLQG